MGGPSLELGVAQPSVSEAVAPHHADSLPSLVAKELASAEAVSAALVAAPVPPGCSEPSCLPEAGSAAYLVRSQLTAVEQDYDVRLEVIDRKSGAVVASAAGSCEVCTEVEVGEMITRTAARLAEPLAGLLSQSAIIVVEGAPDGAAVAIDGQAVGSSPYSGQVEAGTHQLVVSAPDHHSHTETWLAEEGATRTIQFALEPIDQSVRSPAMRRAGWASLGVGLGAIAGGAVTLAFHNRPDKSSCPDGMTDENGRCPQQYDTLGAGLGIMGVGLAAAAAGSALLVVDAKRRKRASVAMTPRSVSLRVSF